MKKLTKTLAILTLPFTLSGCEQAVVDAEMEKLCKQDGGMKVYETVTLPKEQFKYGVPAFLGNWNEAGKAGGGYKVTQKTELLRSKKPTLKKRAYAVIRDTDQKVLGTFVYYQRIGGDIMPRLGPDSFKDCPANLDENIFLKTVFVQAPQEK